MYNIKSRMDKKLEVGGPKIETGRELVQNQIAHCEENDIPVLIVDSTTFKNHPMKVLPETQPLPEIEEFPETNGFREHVRKCLEIYHKISSKSEVINI